MVGAVAVWLEFDTTVSDKFVTVVVLPKFVTVAGMTKPAGIMPPGDDPVGLGHT